MVFRSPESSKKALDLFTASWTYRLMTNKFRCCCRKRMSDLKKKYFYNRWIDVREPGQPDEIKWENLGYSLKERICYRVIVWTIAIALTVGALIVLTYLKYQTDVLRKEYEINLQCPQETSKLQAFLDQ